MSVGAEALELSVGGFGEGTPGAAGSGSGFVVGCMILNGVVIVMTSDDCASEPTSMRYPIGRNVLNPWIREGWPRNKLATR